MKADDINFLPDSYREGERRQRYRTRLLVGAMLFTACLFAWGLSQRGSIDEMRRYARTAEAELAEAQREATIRGKLRARFMQLRRQDGVQSQLAQSVRTTQVLTVLAQRLPEGVGLIELEIVAERPEPVAPGEDNEKSKPTREQAKPKIRERLELRFEAMAPHDAAVNDTIARLTDSPLFDHVVLTFSREDRRTGLIGRRFAIDAVVDLETRYIDATPKEVAHAR